MSGPASIKFNSLCQYEVRDLLLCVRQMFTGRQMLAWEVEKRIDPTPRCPYCAGRLQGECDPCVCGGSPVQARNFALAVQETAKIKLKPLATMQKGA